MNKIYLIKSLAPWMMDELIAFSNITSFEIIFLRKQSDFYHDGLHQLKDNGINIHYRPYSMKKIWRKLHIIISFTFHNINKISFNYNGIIGFKSLIWFLKLDLSLFSPKTKIHSQFATQATIVSLLIKKYYKNKPEYSFTFHAYDIYFHNKWFSMLVKNSYKAFSISKYNINYVQEMYIKSDKIILSRLGVNRNVRDENTEIISSNEFKIGLMSWFNEKKGILYLLQAFLEFKKDGDKNIKLILAGDGPQKEEIINYIIVNNLYESVEYIGKINGMEKEIFYKSLDAFILPSITLPNDQDGIPVVLMEAISYGLPVVSTNISGIPEICINNYNGYLIKEKNVQEIKRAIINLANDRGKITEFKNNSWKLSNKYDIQNNSKKKIEKLKW